MAAGLEAGNQRIAVDAFDRRLTRRVDGGDDHRVGVVEAGAEILEQRLKPGVAVGLHDGDDPAVGRGAGRAQHRLDLHRVVAVIVEDRRAVPLARAGEAALDAAKARQSLADRIRRHAEFVGHRQSGGGVEGVVAAGHRQDEILDLHAEAGAAIADHHPEAALAALQVDVDEAHVGLRVLAVGDDAPVLDMADQILHDRVIDAHHGKAIERDVVDEAPERVLDRLERAEMVEMFGVDVGDDGDIRRQLEEGAVGFVGLDHHPVAGTHAGIGAVGVDDAAIDDGGVEVAGVEQGGDERGRRGLAVGAGHRDAGLEPHQLGEHLGAAHHRQAALAGLDQLRVVAADRGGDHDEGRVLDVLGPVADEGADAVLGQPPDIGVVVRVRALHRIAEIGHDLGDAGHADAADADEVDGAELFGQLHIENLLSPGR